MRIYVENDIYQWVVRRLISSRWRFLESTQQRVKVVGHWQQVWSIDPVGEQNAMEINVILVNETNRKITVLNEN